MKIRNGFVSNSSSSSFIIFGKSTNFCNITPELIKAKKIYACSYEGYDGVDFFPINQKMFDMYVKYGGSLEFYDVDKVIREGGKVSKDEISGDEMQVFAMDVSNHTVQEDDLKDFIERFVDLPPAEDPQHLREQASKIEELNRRILEEGFVAYQDEDGKTKLRKKDED